MSESSNIQTLDKASPLVDKSISEEARQLTLQAHQTLHFAIVAFTQTHDLDRKAKAKQQLDNAAWQAPSSPTP